MAPRNPPQASQAAADDAADELTKAGIANEADLETGTSTVLALAAHPEAPAPKRTGRVFAYDKETGAKLPHKVPVSHLDGRFPNLVETPTSKAGK